MIAALALASSLCFPSRASAAGSVLNCLTLYPTPDLSAASGSIALAPVASPFGVAVTVDGHPRYRLSASITGLPDVRTLGPYGAYVAWAYTLSLDSAIKLGEVKNGSVDLGELNLLQFRILISAERSRDMRERRGRLVLRGTSPSARLVAHRDLMQPSAVGMPTDSSASVSTAMVHGAEHMVAGGALRWTMPPMPAWMPMMPGMFSLVPSTRPFLPAEVGKVRSAPAVARLRSGDTLFLNAERIMRVIGGRVVTLYGFNGRSPGPRVEVQQGAKLTVVVRNDIEQPTAFHWHGVRLDNPFDGAAGLTQPGIAGGSSFTYSLRFPDAGLFWYHPHVREDVQQALGMYGTIVVRSADAAYFGPADREEFMMLGDVLLDGRGMTPFGTDSPTHALMGRFGNTFVVNGASDYKLDVKRGEVARFLLTNVSPARIYNLSFSGAPMKIVAGDAGKFEREEMVRSVVIGPAERYVVDVRFTAAGRVSILNRVQALEHMFGSYTPEVDTIGVVRVGAGAAGGASAREFGTLRRNADVARALAPFRRYFDKPVDHELTLSLHTRNLPAAISNMLLGINAAVEWNDGMPMMNWLTTGNEVTWVLRDPATGKENMDIDWRFRRGDVVKLRIFNDPSTSHAMAHPFHMHGQRFLVLSRDGVRSENLAWKDTAIIPAGETVDLLVDMSNPGRWMMHCHIAEHLSAGMMAAFVVE